MKKVFIVLCALPEESNTVSSTARFLNKYDEKWQAKARVKELLETSANTPYVYWIQKAWSDD